MKFVEPYHACISAHRRWVIIAWALIVVISGVFGFNFLNNTRAVDDLPADTPSGRANAVMTSQFANQQNHATAVVLVRCLLPPPAIVLDTNFTFNLQTQLAQLVPTYSGP